MPVDQKEASRAVLIEVANVLGAFRDELVVVGGWVPELLYPERGHIGSLDVDLAVSDRAVANNAYETIRKRLADAGYKLESDPTRFIRLVSGATEEVKVDLISGEMHNGEKVKSIQVNELRISCLRGVDLAFAACETIEVEGRMPDGTMNHVRIRIVRPEAFILIKAYAMDERAKAKDAYDVAFVLKNYQPSLAALADEVRGLLADPIAADGYRILKAKFAAIDMVGPTWAGQIARDEQGEDFEQFQRAAFEDAQELFRLVDAK